MCSALHAMPASMRLNWLCGKKMRNGHVVRHGKQKCNKELKRGLCKGSKVRKRFLKASKEIGVESVGPPSLVPRGPRGPPASLEFDSDDERCLGVARKAVDSRANYFSGTSHTSCRNLEPAKSSVSHVCSKHGKAGSWTIQGFCMECDAIAVASANTA